MCHALLLPLIAVVMKLMDRNHHLAGARWKFLRHQEYLVMPLIKLATFVCVVCVCGCKQLP